MSKDTVKFHLNDIVYHAVGEDPGIVRGIFYRDNGVTYEVAWRYSGRDEHTEGELSYDRSYHTGQGDDENDDDHQPANR